MRKRATRALTSTLARTCTHTQRCTSKNGISLKSLFTRTTEVVRPKQFLVWLPLWSAWISFFKIISSRLSKTQHINCCNSKLFTVISRRPLAVIIRIQQLVRNTHAHIELCQIFKLTVLGKKTETLQEGNSANKVNLNNHICYSQCSEHIQDYGSSRFVHIANESIFFSLKPFTYFFFWTWPIAREHSHIKI